MQQKITWMHFLITGISAIVLIILISCNKGEIEYNTTTNFVYKNLTNEIVELKLYNQLNENYKNYSILPSSELLISNNYSGSKTGVGEPFSGVHGITLRFSTSDKCLVNYPKLKEVKQYDNFSENMYNTTENTLIYNIDNEELNVAVTCN